MTDTAKPAQRPKRMTLSDVLERLLARSAGDHSSVGLARNAKGETQIDVVVRSGDAGDVTTAEAAAAKAVQLYDQLRARYPMQATPAQVPPAAGSGQ